MAKTNPAKARPKLLFGPLQSKAIFRNKWLRKFRDLLYYADAHAETRATSSTLAWKCQITDVQMQHVKNFYTQAMQLLLTRADFPVEVRPDVSLQDPDRVVTAAAVCKVNPFEAAALMRDVADVQLFWIRKVKHGERMQGVPWQALPLVCRQRMNEHFEWIEMMEKNRMWPCTNEWRETMLEGVIQDEKDRGVYVP